MMNMLLVEDNLRLQDGLKLGFEATGEIQVIAACTTGKAAVDFCFTHEPPQVILMDVALAGPMNGIEAAIAIRREFPRLPIVFYSIQDDDAYYRAFLHARILSHYAYVRKSNYLLPEMLLPLLKDAIAGRSYVDPEIETRVQQVRHRDEHAPMDWLEPNEQVVAQMIAAGMTNEQIAGRLGFRDKRTISRINGQIYTAWGLDSTATDEKVARTRAALIVQMGQLIEWDTDGNAFVLNERGEQVAWQPF